MDLDKRRNVGFADRVVRTGVGALLVAYVVTGTLRAGLALLATIVALVLFVTAAFSY